MSRMIQMIRRILVPLASIPMLATVLAISASAQQSPFFVPGNLIVSVEGCGVHGGTCTAVTNGTGTGTGNSSVTGYGDNQAAAFTLFQYAPNGTSSVSYVNSLTLPQLGAGANLPVSGEYGSSSEGTIQLSGAGQYLTLMGYGINAATFNAAYLPGFSQDPYGAAPSGALGQSGSLTGQSYTAVPRVVTLVDAYGNVNSSTALYNVFNTNNPRSIYTTDGVTSAYVSGQGSGCDATGGVFYTPLGAPNDAPTAITGIDAAPSKSCSISLAQDTRDVQIHNNSLYVSIDTTEGKSFNRSFIGTLGTPPATSLYVPPTATPYVTGPTMLAGFGNTGGTGKETITTGPSSNGNSLNAGLQVNLSPEGYFFASPSVLYVADSGSPKQTSADSLIGDGGLQKWINSKADGSGTWSLAYTLYLGLNLVENNASDSSSTTGTTGLYGLAGTVSGGNVYLYATNFTVSDLDPTFLYGVTDALSTTTNPGTALTQLEAAPSDSNFKGVSFAPGLPAGSATITSSPTGLAFTSAGTGCMPGTYTTPVTLLWTPGNSCTLSVVSPIAVTTGTQLAFTQWQDGTTGTSDKVTAPSSSAVYTATFATDYQLTTTAETGGTISAGGYFAAGSNAMITATPSAGYYFVNFTGATTSTNNPLTLPVTGPESIAANFAAQIVPTLTFAPVSSQLVGAAPFAVSATSASTGAVTYGVASGPATISGNLVTVNGVGTVVLTANQAASESYAAATTTTSFMVSQPAPTVPTLTFAPIPTKEEGAAPFAVSATSASSGVVTYAVTSGPATVSGNLVTVTGVGTVVLAANQAASGNYTAATATTSFTVGLPFTLGISTGSAAMVSVAPGAAASFSLTLTPSAGATFFDPISLTATGLPAGATASFSPASVAAGSAMTTVKLSIQTANNSQTARNEHPNTSNPLAPIALGFLLLPLLGTRSARKRLRQMPRLPLALLVAGLSLGAMLGISGCAGSSPVNATMQPPQTYTVVVTATDTTTKVQGSTNVTLAVQ